MTNKEAMEFLKSMADREATGFACPQGEGDVAIWQYHTEALRMGIAALEKQIPKKPVMGYAFAEKMRNAIKKVDPERAEAKTDCCPVCGRSLGVSQYVKTQTGLAVGGEYCKRCGQAIDWTDGNEDSDYERAIDQLQHDMLYESTYDQDNGSM